MLTKKISKEDILSKVDDYNIFTKYFGEFIVGEGIYKSKFREDKNPSTGFYLSKTNKLIYNDLSTGEKLDCFGFVAKLYNCSFPEAVQRIAFDFGLTDAEVPKVELKQWNPEDAVKKEKVIWIKADKWTVINLDFWKDFHITERELVENDVYPVKELHVDDKVIPNYHKKLRYAYLLKDVDKSYMKVYSPYENDFKWVSSIPNAKPFGLRELPKKSKTLIITKGQKDRIIWKKYFTDVIALQHESLAALPEEIIWQLQGDYDNIWINCDADEAGCKAMKDFEVYGFKPITVPDKIYKAEGIKDFSDMVKAKGLELFEKYLKFKNLL